MSVRVFAPAKINLSLQVGAAREDGFHPLQSVVVFADVGDWIEAAPAETLSLEVCGPFAPALAGEGDNLVLRAARALADEAGVQAGARIVLDKRLPVASGIGGGSSDAAATLKALNSLWTLGFSEQRLMQVGERIGADVPVCVAARSAWMTGVGERVAPMRTPLLAAVLVNPRKALPTRDVFRAFDRIGHASPLAGAMPQWRDADALVMDLRARGNDLAAPARALMPEVAEIERVLRADPRVRYACLSGSGATVFALMGDAAAANALASEITHAHPQWWSCATLLGGS